ncbi:DUF6153 family protein [Streptomyces sp. GQFP]|nr:DUF6153 family protein [Streptomyces sp. GQFP]
MTARAQRSRRLRRAHPPSWWARAFVVLGLLAGVVAMHGLAPGGGTTSGAHHGNGSGHHQAEPMSAQAGPADETVCHGSASPGGHVHHADATCASGAIPAGHRFPALTPDPAGAPPLAHGVGRSLPRSPEGARAPPSLAELQLLRI